jgi:hypothetical protein
VSRKKREFELRFAIKKDGKVGSAIWYVWKKKDDIYIAQDKIGGYVKTSLHSNRHCRVAITKENYTPITGKTYSGSRPVITSWDRPETNTDGYVICVSILFVPELLSPHDVVYDRDTIEIESPCSGKAISVDMVFTRLAPERIAPNPSQGVLGHTQLSTGEHFIVIGGIIHFDINEFSQRANLSLPSDADRTVNLSDPSLPSVRVALFDNSLDHLRVLDIAAELRR